MKKITFLVYGFFILWSLVSFAQDGAVKGRVLDGAFPLPGATIQLSGTQKNASTDFEGNYTITGIAAGNYEMTVTYLGYEKASQSVSVEAGKVTPVPNIIMKSTTDELEEVVVSANASRRLSEAKVDKPFKTDPFRPNERDPFRRLKLTPVRQGKVTPFANLK